MSRHPALEPEDPRTGSEPEGESGPGLRLSASRGLGYLGLFVGAQLLLGALGGFAVGVHSIVAGGEPADARAIEALMARWQGLIGVVAAALGGCVFAAVALLRHRGRRWVPFRQAVGATSAGAGQIAAAALAGAAIAVSYLVVASFLVATSAAGAPGPVSRMATTPGIQQQVWTWYALLGSPPIEEFALRGVMLAYFAASWGVAPAVVFTTAVFVGLHASEIAVFWPAALGLGGMSLAASALRLRTGSVLPAIAAHLGYNLVIVLVVRSAGALSRGG